MKIEVNLERKYFISSLIIGLLLIGFVGVYAYNSGGNPVIFGHSVDEMNWSNAINANMRINGNLSVNNFSASRICIGTDCRTVWPSEGGSSQWTTLGNDIYYNTGNVNTTNFVKAAGFCIGTNCITSWPPGGGSNLPTCSNGAILMVVNNAWACGRDGNCGIAGTCSQVCIGSSCKTSWPTGVGDISCASAQAVVRITNGVPICGPSDTNRYWRYKTDSKVFYCGPTSDNRFTICNNAYHNYYYVCYNSQLTMIVYNYNCASLANQPCNGFAAGTVCAYGLGVVQGTAQDALDQNFCGYTQNHYITHQTTGVYVCE